MLSVAAIPVLVIVGPDGLTRPKCLVA
eukprot:COSAG01_NODE_65784_length_272_cov_0.612717_1_plen_26_part_10